MSWMIIVCTSDATAPPFLGGLGVGRDFATVREILCERKARDLRFVVYEDFELCFCLYALTDTKVTRSFATYDHMFKIMGNPVRSWSQTDADGDWAGEEASSLARFSIIQG